jgi:hypothetical protein
MHAECSWTGLIAFLDTVDLRKFFKAFIDDNIFECFHFKRRPEPQAGTGSTSPHPPCMCVIRLSVTHAPALLAQYHGKPWVDKQDQVDDRRVIIEVIDSHGVAGGSAPAETRFLTRNEIAEIRRRQRDWDSMPELHPPAVFDVAHMLNVRIPS